MAIKKDKDDVFVVDTLTDIFDLLERNGISVRVSDNYDCSRNRRLRDLDIEESYEEVNDEHME